MQRGRTGRSRRAPRVGASVAVVSPLTIFLTTPPAAWWRADLGLVSAVGAAVTLADQTTNGRNLAVLGAGPTVNAADASLSGRQTLTCGAGQSMFNTFSVAVPYTLLLIAKPTVWNNSNVLLGDNGGRGLVDAGGSPNVFQQSGLFVNSTPAALGTWYRFRGKFQNTIADALKIGTPAETTGAAAGSTALNPSIGINLAGGVGTGSFDFYEAVILPGIATPAEYAAYDSYVTAKTGGAAQV